MTSYLKPLAMLQTNSTQENTLCQNISGLQKKKTFQSYY